MANVYFGDTIGQADQNWNTSIQFTVSSVGITPTAGATYTNNTVTFTVTSASIAAGSGTINAGGSGTSTASGTLTKVSGTGDATITFSSKADVNWFSDPGSVVCGCCCTSSNVPGTPLGRLPTLADSVIVYRTINVAPNISPWTTAVQVATLPVSGSPDSTSGNLLAGTFDGTVTCSGSAVLGGTAIFNGAVTVTNITGGTFNSSVTSGNIVISGGTFNGTIVNSGGTSTSNSGLFEVQAGGTAVFNCALPNNCNGYNLSSGTYTVPLVLGLAAPTSGPAVAVTINSGFSTAQNITINTLRLAGANGGTTTINGGTFTGLITINRLSQSGINVNGGSYSPPAVTTPSIKSGNNMTFSSAAIPTDWGFVAANGTFNPTILLSGTSNDILGSGLP